MNTIAINFGKGLGATFLLTLAAVANASTVWMGPEVSFTKDAFADWTLAENQDQITALVSLTRADTSGLFNAAQEAGHEQFQNISPAGTAWAFQGMGGNPDNGISAADYESLNFTDWTSALGIQQVGRNIVGRPGVVHLIDDDVYLDIVFTEWGMGGGAGGSFSYTRSSPMMNPVPIPAAAWLFGSALGLLGWVRRRSV